LIGGPNASNRVERLEPTVQCEAIDHPSAHCGSVHQPKFRISPLRHRPMTIVLPPGSPTRARQLRLRARWPKKVAEQALVPLRPPKVLCQANNSAWQDYSANDGRGDESFTHSAMSASTPRKSGSQHREDVADRAGKHQDMPDSVRINACNRKRRKARPGYRRIRRRRAVPVRGRQMGKQLADGYQGQPAHREINHHRGASARKRHLPYGDAFHESEAPSVG